MIVADCRCMDWNDNYEIRYECLDCRQITTVLYSLGHPLQKGYSCEGCGGEGKHFEMCPHCGGRDVVKEGTL